MDLSAAFKTEVYRPVVTIVIPGIVALAPLACYITVRYPGVHEFASSHTLMATIACLLAVIAAGFFLEDLGSLVESRLWEPIQGDTEGLMKDWYEYLRLAFAVEPLGQKYIGTVVMRLKFELSFGIALIICGLGFTWLNYAISVGFPGLAIIAFFILAAYLLYESFQSTKLLRKTRHELLTGIKVIGKAGDG